MDSEKRREDPKDLRETGGRCEDDLSRRSFIGESTKQITVFASAGALAALAAACGGGGGPSPTAPNPTGGGNDNGGGNASGLAIDISQSQYSALANVGGTVSLSGTSLSGLPSNGIFIIRSSQTSVTVLSRTCTHQGCQVGSFNSGGIATCPCHGSQYNTMGSVVQGPATGSLTSYSATLEGNIIEINI
ncbi:MAG: Rieske (2Fe-2S) protein [Candidatus Glassbacteria bacterium]|nr:Rieske (2Fe-2S) protein [Candidatus Glassbacteria bacterium]